MTTAYTVSIRVPTAARTGRWTVKVGLFDPDFQKLLGWRPNAAAFRVR